MNQIARWVAVPVILSVVLAATVGRAAPAPKKTDRFAAAKTALAKVNFRALRMAIADLTRTFPGRYTKGPQYLMRAIDWEKKLPAIRKALDARDEAALKQVDQIVALQREAMLANPLVDFEKLLLIKRKPVGDPRRAKGTGRGLGEFIGLPRQSSWQHDRIPNAHSWDNEIAVLSPVRPEGKLTTLLAPSPRRLMGDIELRFDGKRLLFSMPSKAKTWQIFEIGVDGKGRRQVTADGRGDVHNYDACYLPNGQIAFISTAPLQGVPCNKTVNVAMLYVMDANGKNIRQLAFDQDHNYCPTLTNDGRILYLRWEYTDLPHVWGRYLFTMNPDGTGQREYYGTGSYWPNGIFYARPIPGHPTRVVTIVTGHHVGRVGELVIFDPARGHRDIEGVVQRIPGYGKSVKPLIQDKLTEHSWPKFLHPWPLADTSPQQAAGSKPLGAGKYFLVAAKPRPNDLWGIYLVDIFDNMTLIKELEGNVLLEPVPLRPRTKPPVIADRVNLNRKDALIFLEDIHAGEGLVDVPRGSVKSLRLFTYHFVYQKMAGINHNIGTDGPWEPKRVLGTVPVEKDGSAFFRVPANTPISIQPLDAEGRALQLMRSWTTAMPGEIVSCTGCHEKLTDAAPNMKTIAAGKPPAEIRPWHGPARGFSFNREVQPVLDKYCVSCHDGGKRKDGKTIPDLRREQGKYIVFRNSDPQERVIRGTPQQELVRKYAGVFDPSYVELRRYVRTGGLESDIRMLNPGEFGADTSELIQMLEKGHHGVRLDREAWHRLTIWIDLNAPCHGTWREAAGLKIIKPFHGRRRELRRLYAGLDDDPEAYPEMPVKAVTPVKPKPVAEAPVKEVTCPDWPFDAAEAAKRQTAAARTTKRSVSLGRGLTLDLVLIPPGDFVMGDRTGYRDERPLSRVSIAKGFWMGTCEVTNEQYRRFEASHNSRFEHKGSWQFSERHLGWRLNHPKQPVVRVSLKQADAFCRWLSKKTRLNVTVPTEAQWEYACRAGTAGPMSYGDLDTDFSPFANLADRTIRQLAYDTDGRYTADITPRDARFDDKALVTNNVGSYKSNAWGLKDMHGNAWEWTRSAYWPYPYRDGDGRNAPDAGPKVVRGGSWRDRPTRCRSAFRLPYPAWRKIYNVGFRVVIEQDQAARK